MICVKTFDAKMKEKGYHIIMSEISGRKAITQVRRYASERPSGYSYRGFTKYPTPSTVQCFVFASFLQTTNLTWNSTVEMF